MKMENPYHTLGEAFVSSVVAGNRGKIEGKQEGLPDRLRQFAYYTTENAVEAGDALLANDLLDAAKRLSAQPKADAAAIKKQFDDYVQLAEARIAELETQIAHLPGPPQRAPEQKDKT